MMLMKYFKIYDNELCPCGSGKTYLECCKNRKDRPVKKVRSLLIYKSWNSSEKIK